MPAIFSPYLKQPIDPDKDFGWAEEIILNLLSVATCRRRPN
jgi:hypothetical protein